MCSQAKGQVSESLFPKVLSSCTTHIVNRPIGIVGMGLCYTLTSTSLSPPWRSRFYQASSGLLLIVTSPTSGTTAKSSKHQQAPLFILVVFDFCLSSRFSRVRCWMVRQRTCWLPHRQGRAQLWVWEGRHHWLWIQTEQKREVGCLLLQPQLWVQLHTNITWHHCDTQVYTHIYFVWLWSSSLKVYGDLTWGLSTTGMHRWCDHLQ